MLQARSPLQNQPTVTPSCYCSCDIRPRMCLFCRSRAWHPVLTWHRKGNVHDPPGQRGKQLLSLHLKSNLSTAMVADQITSTEGSERDKQPRSLPSPASFRSLLFTQDNHSPLQLELMEARGLLASSWGGEYLLRLCDKPQLRIPNRPEAFPTHRLVALAL